MSEAEPSAYPVEAPVPGAAETRTFVRALSGMQKEAVVACSGRSWRLFCDEGHYLNGTDLAPPPLDFFSAGLSFSILAAVVEVARREDVPLDGLGLEQRTVYHIEGSFLGGNALGSADAPAVEVVVESSASENAVLDVVRSAVESAPGLALARDVLDNRFGLTVGAPVDDVFERLPAERELPDPPVISKLEQAERVENDPHGAGVGLRAEQKRTIQIEGRAEWLGESRFRTDVTLIHPIGSRFRFHSDAGGATAPSPDALLAAGVAFCYMTQLGRYASILKKPLADYRLLQTSRFELAGGSAVAAPFETQVFLPAEWSEAEAADLVRVGERTCYLHATMRQELEPRVAVHWKGRRLEL